jgi:predicted dehydrogenase
LERVRVGVVGCGLVAQLMHLHYLRELGDRFVIAALCDVSAGTLAAVADTYDVARRYTDWRRLLDDGAIDALMVLTSTSHAEPAIAAFEQGLHVFVEKPMAVTLGEADRMIDAGRRAGRTLTVGYMKRHDPAYALVGDALGTLRDLRHVGITTLESPIGPYVEHESIKRVADLSDELIRDWADTRRRLTAEALGQQVDDITVAAYHDLLLDSAIHELNLLRGLLGDPEAVLLAEFWDAGRSMHVVLAYPGELRVSFSFVWLEELPEYVQELAFRGPAARLTVRFPSPFLRNAPTTAYLERHDGAALHREQIIASYDEAFRRELLHFRDTVVDGRLPLTSPEAARGDIALAGLIARAWLTGRPQPVVGLDLPPAPV